MPPPCSVCTHKDKDAINKLIVSGEPNRRIASLYGLTETSIRRHRAAGHIAAKIAKAADARERVSADKLLEIIEAMLSTSIGIVRDARASGDNRTALSAVRETRETAKVLLEVAGELDNGTAVQVNVGIQTITSAPEWPILIRVLDRHPEVHAELLAALEAGH